MVLSFGGGTLRQNLTPVLEKFGLSVSYEAEKTDVGAIGVFVFSVALRHWPGERQVRQET